MTYGTGSSDGNGYRGPLRSSLTGGGGYTVNMVGFNPHGTMKDSEQDGYPGLKVAEVAGKAARILDELKPNLVLVNAGTNDCLSGSKDPDRIDAEMGGLLDPIYDADGGNTAVVLSALLVNANADADACARRVTEKYKARVAAGAAAGHKIVLADMSAITKGDLGGDGTHPTDAGYKKMADGWYAAIQDLDGKGWISRATPVSGIPDDGNDGPPEE